MPSHAINNITNLSSLTNSTSITPINSKPKNSNLHSSGENNNNINSLMRGSASKQRNLSNIKSN